MDRLVQEIRLAVRGLCRSPTFAATAIAILAIGMGMAGAMYSVVDAVLIRPLPVRDPTHVVVPHARDRSGVDLSLAGEDFEDLRHSTHLMREVAGVYHAGAFVMPLDLDGRPIVLRQAIVTGNFFEMLGVRPVLGRLLRPEDDATGAGQAVVLSYGAWRRQFGGDPRVLGKQLRSPFEQPPYKNDYRIVGVAPPGLDFPVGVDIWTETGLHSTWQLDAIGRLAPGASIGAARAEFLGITQRLGQRRESRIDVATADIRTLPDAISGGVRPVLVVVGAAVVFLLVIAYVNVSNLLLVRGAVRSPEFIIRRAIGGTARDVMRLLSLESGVIVAVAAIAALGLARALQGALLGVAPSELPRTDLIRLAGQPLIAVASAALLAMLLFAALSWLVTGRWTSSPRLSVEGRSGKHTRQRRRLGQMLVGAQVALAVVMLTGTGLLVRTLVQLERVKLGYSADHLSILTVGFPMTTKYDTIPKQVPLVDALSARIGAIPGVTALTPVIAPAFAGPQVWTDPWEAEGETVLPGNHPNTPTEAGGADYFRTFGIPILQGRGILPTDGEHTPLVAVVSVAVAQRFWPGANPIGKRIRMGPSDPWHTVVGVAGDTHFRTLRTATPMVYVPWSQYFWQAFLAVRSSVPLAIVLPNIRHAVQSVDPTVTLWQAAPLAESVDEQLAQPRLSTLLMSGFGLVALLLTAVGLYGVMGSTVREETHDLGVRMALGATPGQVQRAVLQRALRVVLAGVVFGLAGAVAASRLVRSLLFDVSPEDPAALVGACVVLLGVALVAAYLPARYASRVDPALALQAE